MVAARTAMRTNRPARTFEFDLIFKLPAEAPDPDTHVDALFEAGCDDALPGVGLPGTIALAFAREASTATEAMTSALRDVRKAIPGAVLVEAKPDLVGPSEIAEIFGCSRQNIRKHLIDKPTAPPPAHVGNPSLWHLAEVSGYLGACMRLSVDPAVIEAAESAWQLNLRERAVPSAFERDNSEVR